MPNTHNELNVGRDSHAQGPVVLADAINDSFNRFDSLATDGESKQALKALSDAITAMIAELPADKQQDAAKDFEIIADEAARQKPRTGILNAVLDDLTAIAAVAAKYGAPVVALVKSIRGLIKRE
jgi:hypothetical protein